MPTEKPKPSIISTDRFVSICLILAALIVVPSGFMQGFNAGDEIREEYLPHVTTLTEIEHRIESLENTFRTQDKTIVLQDLTDLRAELAQYHADESDPDTAQRIHSLADRLDVLEGAVYFYHKKRKAAKKTFTELLRRTPSIMLDSRIATPKLAQYFENLRETLVGYLTVTTVPDGASVFVDGSLLGETPLVSEYVPAGAHTVLCRHEGFAEVREEVKLRAGKETKLQFVLEKTSGSCDVTTSPPGVEVYLDGELKGTTSGLLPEEYIGQARAKGIDPATVSAPLHIDYIEPGKHRLVFKKPCFKTREFSVDIGMGSYFVPPVLMTPVHATLEIDSLPEARPVFIDGEPVGETPLRMTDICPGHREIRVDLGSPSGWSGRIDIAPDDVTRLAVRPRPTLIWLGCAGKNARLCSEASQRIETWLRSLNRFNIPPRDIAEQIRIRPLVAALIERLNAYAPGETDIPWRDLLSALPLSLNDTGATLYAAAIISDTGSPLPGSLYLIHRDHVQPDRLALPPGLPPVDIPDDLRIQLTRRLLPATRWLGLKLIDSDDGVLVIDIDIWGPAVSSRIKPGDLVRRIDGRDIRRVADLRDYLDDPSGKGPVVLAVARGKKTFEETLTPFWQPLTLPLAEPSLPYNLLLADLNELAVIPWLKDACLLNAGICRLALGDPAQALEKSFRNCSLPEGPGVSKGTLLYLEGLTLKQLNDPKAAQKAFSEAAGMEHATFLGPDGPQVSILAEVELP